MSSTTNSCIRLPVGSCRSPKIHHVVILLTLLPLASAGFIDIDTPLDKRTTTSLIDGTEYELIMSDEFNVENRTFGDGHDPMWTALDKSDDDSSNAGGGSMQFYNSSAVTTENGYLKISSFIERTEWTRYDEVNKKWKQERKNFTSGMVQSWNKFCFTGGIVEVDVIFPGDPFVGGLWPAVWLLGNLGRATYLPSTNNIWPWSYNKCTRELQDAQTISACNQENHFGLKPFQGRGATEIDIVEVMTGDSDGPLPSTRPPISLPYADLTLQVAPGIPDNRPQSGHLPVRKTRVSGHTAYAAETWYTGLHMEGNTSINPFFYGTYMAETKPEEPVTRTKKQAFQADAVGVAHQLTPSHFRRPHTFRLEWQPGAGGRVDWYVKGYQINETLAIEGDGKGQDWVHVYGLEDSVLSSLTGAQIPIEPSYLIMNTAISSTWGFPYDVPAWCVKCYDCDDPKCACNFNPGFCEMMRRRNVDLFIDSIRVYQSKDDSVHVGAPHTVGCDPPDYPTQEWILGHAYRYVRNPPFSNSDKGLPLRRVPTGGGSCVSDVDCGGLVENENLTAAYDELLTTGRRTQSLEKSIGRGKCVDSMTSAVFSALGGKMCECFEGFTGPKCMSLRHIDDTPSAYKIRLNQSPFHRIENFEAPLFFLISLGAMISLLFAFGITKTLRDKRDRLLPIRPPPPPQTGKLF